MHWESFSFWENGRQWDQAVSKNVEQRKHIFTPEERRAQPWFQSSSQAPAIAQLQTVLEHTQRKSRCHLNGICEPRINQKQKKQSVSQKRDNTSFGEKLGYAI